MEPHLVDDRSSAERRRPIAIAVTFTVVGGISLFLTVAYSITLQAELDFGGSELGLAVGGYFLGSIVAAQAGGLVDRVGSGVGLRASALLSASSAAIIGIFATSWQWVAAALVVSGVANSVGQMASNRLLAGLPRQGLGFGIKQAAAPLPGLIAGFAVATVGPHVPWRTVFAIVSVLAVGAAVGLPGGIEEPPIGSHRPSRHGSGRHRSQLIALAAAGAVGGATGNSIALLAVDSLSKAGFAEAGEVWILTAGSGMTVFARVAVGWWLDHSGSNGYRELVRLMVAGAAGLFLVSRPG